MRYKRIAMFLSFLIGIVVANLLKVEEMISMITVEQACYQIITNEMRERFFLHLCFARGKLLLLFCVALALLKGKEWAKKIFLLISFFVINAGAGIFVSGLVRLNGLRGGLLALGLMLPHGFFYWYAFLTEVDYIFASHDKYSVIAYNDCKNEWKRRMKMVISFIIGVLLEGFFAPMVLKLLLKL